jgi:hypothetical protein
MDNRTRSPRYPNVNLQSAIEKTRLIYEKEHRHKVDKEVVALDLGYTGLNGASAGMIASLRQYNLLEVSGDALKVTDDAVTILELPQGEDERVDAIQRVAFAPKIFSELREIYGDKLPSIENLRLYLIKQGYNSKAASVVIRTYRETLSLVQEEMEGYNNEDSNDSHKTNMNISNTVSSNPQMPRPLADLSMSPNIPTGNFSENLQYRLSDDCRVRVLFEGNVTREAIKKLIAYLQLGMDDFRPKTQQQETLHEVGQPMLLTDGE